jgi:predicted phage-related endonuclease
MAIILDVIQGSPEWLALRQSSLGATSASVLSGTNPFKRQTFPIQRDGFRRISADE